MSDEQRPGEGSGAPVAGQAAGATRASGDGKTTPVEMDDETHALHSELVRAELACV